MAYSDPVFISSLTVTLQPKVGPGDVHHELSLVKIITVDGFT